VGLKLISLIKPNVDILSLDVAAPHVYIVIGRDGRTNIPEPKIKTPHTRTTMESILDLAIDRFHLYNGVFEVEAQSRVPIDLAGRNLAIALAYDVRGPRYKGTLHADPLNILYDDYGPEPFTTNLGITLERNRITIDSGRLATRATTVDIKGALEDLANPHAVFQYVARASLADIARIFRVPELRRGSGMAAGTGSWNPDAGIALRASVHATGVEYRDNTVQLSGIRADSSVDVGAGIVNARGSRFSGFYVRGEKREPTDGTIQHVQIRKRDLDLRGIAVTVLGGTFKGEARVRGLEQYFVDGAIAGVQATRTAAMYSPVKLPWDALVYGNVHVQGAFHQPLDLKAAAELTLAPAPTGPPVSGLVIAAWDARKKTLDLGHSAVALPHSRAEFSGTLGGELRVHLETRDLEDLLPALGKSAADFPVKLNNGSVVFDGSANGAMDALRVAGHLRAAGVALSGQPVDSFEGDVVAAPESVSLQNGVVARGALRAQVQGSVVLTDWKATDASPIAGRVAIPSGPLKDLLAIAGAKNLDADGTLGVTAFVSGNVGAPRVESNFEVARGSFQGEPFDRVTGQSAYGGHVLELKQAQIVAGPKQVRVSGSYDHDPQHLDRGRVRFDIATSAMPLESIRVLHAQRDNITGTVQATASGEAQLDPGSRTPWRFLSLNADVTGKGLEVADQPVGDAHLTAQSQGNSLRAHLDSTVAGAVVKGDGQWRLEGDYPGQATVTFSKLDLANLRAWMSSSETARIAGSMDGEFRIQGPALDWKALQAELRIPRLEIGPAPNTELASAPLRVTNQGPLVARYANSVVTIDSVHLIGRGTDLTVGGRILTDQRLPLDLRVDGHADLSLLQDFVPDVVARGTVATSATVRGSLADPQLLGRMEFKDAAFSITDVPNGISKATGVVAFTKERATIQSLTGETGGGKIDLAGFVQYGGGPIVFRLHAQAREVRVRYPEGVSTVANASLNLTGTEDSSTLSGNITVLRSGINLQSDFSSILAKSAEPVRTPSAKPGLLGGMSFDVQVETAPDTQLETSLTEGIQAEANLRVRGTLQNPAVLGRVTITQGKVNFFGTQYTVNQGTVSFYNPIKVEPILNIDLETRARGIDITLTVSGPLNKLKLTPRSDPPLQFGEIVALLAQGRTPTSDPSLMRQQLESPQTFQQSAASALLGSAIASPVSGRLQRFFGVSRLRIDPSLSGIENNPGARITLEQQVTPNLTITYVTNVTNSNPQVVRVEWSLSKTFSAVALREENGLLGLDFFYKKRFK
ncbi:MAG TPA: translocation/assembly module TamB domain-containing protein, partial [Candidatus Acidoferrum sp.]|nr:translocation/assembly module TamB domain-containing protein [Candidatus Acidoferrum sp.]